MSKLKITKADSKQIEDLFAEIMEEEDDFELLKDSGASFLFTFRNKEMFDDEGNQIAAFAAKINNRERDIYGFDFEICFVEDIWDVLPPKEKYRLLYHELLHCQVAYDEEEEEFVRDEYERLSTWIEPHDLIIKTFRQEIERFGLHQRDYDVASFLHKHYAKTLSKPEVTKKKGK